MSWLTKWVASLWRVAPSALPLPLGGGWQLRPHVCVHPYCPYRELVGPDGRVWGLTQPRWPAHYRHRIADEN